MSVRRKLFWITAFIVFMAVAIVLCVELFSTVRETEFDGTLVRKAGELLTLADLRFPYLI
jgi:hypothetical protein